MATLRDIRENLKKLRTKSDPKYRADAVAIANALEDLLDAQIKGGRNGGTARAKKLSKKRRVEIARNAANARWGKRKENGNA